MKTKYKPKKIYEDRLIKFNKKLEQNKKAILLLSVLRLIIFIVGIFVSIYLFKFNTIAGFLSFLLFVSAFGIILKLFVAKVKSRTYNANMIKINQNGLNSLNENYDNFDSGQKHIDPSHNFSYDLDIFGHKSLFQALNRTCTEQGGKILANWLQNPLALSEQFAERVEAVKELTTKLNWRQKFTALGMINHTNDKETDALCDWLQEKPKLRGKKFYYPMLIIIPALTCTLLILTILGSLSYSFFIMAFLANLLLLSFKIGAINEIHSKVTKRYSYLSVLASLIKHFEEAEFKTSFLRKLKSNFGKNNISALSKVNKLAGILQAFDSRLNMLMGVVLNGLLLWDYQCVFRIEKWKNDVSELVPIWFNNIAIVDAILSIANFTFNKPSYVFPIISDKSQYLLAKNLGHPLINSSKRVLNDYKIDKPSEIDVITGANMSGKSTFLRTVGVNLILAMCGAPVCASYFSFTPVELFSSMRTSDSLSEDESYFFAELKRLKMLITKINENDNVLFLLDEILKGTNSKDKSDGSKEFVKKIIGLHGTGLIATHDLSLGSLENEFSETVKNYCFEIEIENAQVNFDFKLQPGITTKMNAVLLMKQQGII